MAEQGVLLRADALSKWFGGTRALREATVHVRAGEIHAIVGANGSGKSTLVKVISGALEPDSGAVTACVPGLAVGTIHQNLGLVGEATVRENVCAALPDRVLSPSRETRTVEALFGQLGVAVPADAPVQELPIDRQALVALARALAEMTGARGAVLVVDEATSVLRGSAAARFADVLRRLREERIGIVLVSHDLDEVLDLADRVSVIVDGAVLACRPARGLGREELIELMTGAAVSDPAHDWVAARAPDEADAVLTAEGLGGAVVRDVRLAVRPGEVVGVVGVPGSGYDELPYLLAGGGGHDRRGEVRIDGRAITSPASFAGAGGKLVPADRLRTALVPTASVSENFWLDHRGGWGRRSLRAPRRERAIVESAVRTYGIKCEGVDAPIVSLSGGNQQKLIMARCLQSAPRVLIVHEPTQGVDVGARHELLTQLRAALATGRLGVVYACGDVDEVWENSDRVVTMRRGAVSGVTPVRGHTPDVLNGLLY
jgi:ribose transport system ATP-binding protein